MDERVELHVTGKVQGVFYRASTQQKALALGLRGWVKNMPDGPVQAVVEGPRPALEALVAWCHKGPPAARVDEVKTKWKPATGEFQSFTVRR